MHLATPAGSEMTDEMPAEKSDSKQTNQGNNINNKWYEVESDVAQMRETLDEEKLARNIRKHEIKRKETVLINRIKKTLREEQQARTRVEEELSQVRIACN